MSDELTTKWSPVVVDYCAEGCCGTNIDVAWVEGDLYKTVEHVEWGTVVKRYYYLLHDDEWVRLYTAVYTTEEKNNA